MKLKKNSALVRLNQSDSKKVIDYA